LLVGLGLAAALQRRAALAARLAAEAEAMAELERRVADRTAALTAEVAERRAAEGRLRAAQDELVQAGKLSALGRMAAGLAHELNQPLAAIRGFAENGAVFLDRGRTEEARGNLARIAELTERAAQIIRHLRAFARNQPQSAAPTDMVAVVDDALALLSVEIKAAEARIDWRRPEAPVVAVGGAVRLQQVVVNLISNALDAQRGAEAPVVEIALGREGDRVRLAIADHGPGLSAEAEGRVFDPFFTTKRDGDGGLGLGLSISYGIVKGFGGELSAGARPGGGALFAVDLAAASAAAEPVAA
ncbi:MAG: ATP-binding protein, partial [Pseudomonadota bacterium]